jgi:ribosomal protein L15E
MGNKMSSQITPLNSIVVMKDDYYKDYVIINIEPKHQSSQCHPLKNIVIDIHNEPCNIKSKEN